MVDIMRGFGIDAVPAVGSEFDPEIHEAIMREPSDEVRGCSRLTPALAPVGACRCVGLQVSVMPKDCAARCFPAARCSALAP